MWKFIAIVAAIFFAFKSGSDYLAGDRFLEYADRTKAPWTCRVDYLVGQYLTVASRYGDASKVFKRISARCPNTEIAERADFELARSFETGGKRSDAIDAYQKYIEKYPNGPRLKLALRSLDNLRTL